MTTLEDLVIKFNGDTKDVTAKLNKLQSDLGKTSKTASLAGAGFKKALGVLGGALAIGKITSDFNKTIGYMDDMSDAADRVGISSEAFSKLAYAAKATEVPLGTLEVSLRKMQLALVEASGNASSKAAQALKFIGLEAGKLRDVGADEALAMIADGLNKVPDPANKAAAAQAIFGRGAIQLADLLKEGGAAIRAYGDEAQKFGVVVSKEAAQKAEEFKKALVRLETQWQGMIIELNNDGALDNAISAIGGLITAVSDLYSGIKDITVAWKDFLGLSDSSSLEAINREIDRTAGKIKINQMNAQNIFLSPDDLINGTTGSKSDAAALQGKMESLALQRQVAELKQQGANLDKKLGGYGVPTAPPLGGTKQTNLFADDDSQKKADAEHEKALSKALGYYQDSKTEVEKIQDTIVEINKLHDDGAFKTEDQYSMALIHQRGLLDEAQKQTDSLENDIRNIGNTITEGIGGELVDAMKRGESAGKALWDSFRYRAINAIGEIAAKMVERQIGSMFGGSGTGSSTFGFGDFLTKAGSSIWDALPSFDSGGATGNGSGSGVDGKGGFPALLHPNEIILNKDQQQGLSGGSKQFTQNVNIIATDDRSIDRRVQAQAPMIAQMAASLVKSEMGRGGDMSKQVGRRL